MSPFALQIPRVRVPKLPTIVDLLSVAHLFEFRTVSRWVLLGLLVGVSSGLAACCFFLLVDWIAYLVLDHLAHSPPSQPAGEPRLFVAGGQAPAVPWLQVLAPALGGFVSGVIVHFSRVEGESQGHDGLIQAFHHPRVRIGLRGPLSRALAAVAVIGTGGSAGREGPVAFLGAGIGAAIARGLGLSPREQRLLLLAGAAGGIAAIFRSPLGGALFVLEVLYRDDFEADAIVPTVLSAVVGYSVFTLVFGETSMFAVAASYDFKPLQLPFYLVMAVGVGLVGVAFVKALHWGEERFRELAFPSWLKATLGGLLVGCCALVVPEALGAGYGALQRVLLTRSEDLAGWSGAGLLLSLALAKMLTTTLTVGSGGSGGVFGPSLVIGGMVGGAFGVAAHEVAPTVVPDPGAFVVVGMACFLGGVANAPLSTLVMASEMTRSYGLLVPVMLAEVVAFSISRSAPLYRFQVLSRRESQAHVGDYITDLLQDLRVQQVIAAGPPIHVFTQDASLEELLRHAAGRAETVFPMADATGRLTGLLTLDTLKVLFSDPELKHILIAADCAEPLVFVAPEDSLAAALERFAKSRYPQLPVIDPAAPNVVLGLLGYEQLLQAYSSELVRRRGPGVDSPP